MCFCFNNQPSSLAIQSSNLTKQIVWNNCKGDLNNLIWKPIEAHHCRIFANHFVVYLNGHINHGKKILLTFHETRVGEWCLQKSWYVPCSKGSLLYRFVITNNFSTSYTPLKRLCEMMVSSHKNTHQGSVCPNSPMQSWTLKPMSHEKTLLTFHILVGCNLDLYNGLL